MKEGSACPRAASSDPVVSPSEMSPLCMWESEVTRPFSQAALVHSEAGGCVWWLEEYGGEPGAPWLEVIEVLDAGRVRARLRGELDLADAPTASESLRRLRERGDPVLLELDEVEFIDMR